MTAATPVIGTSRRLAGRLANLGWSRDDASELAALSDPEWADLLLQVGMHASALECANAVDLLRSDQTL